MSESKDRDFENCRWWPVDAGERQDHDGVISNNALFASDVSEMAEEVESHLLELEATRHPELNSALLLLPAGTVFLVIDGIAYGYRSDTTYRRIHYRCYSYWTRGNPRAHVRVCPRFYTVPNVNFIQTDIMDDACRLRHRNGTVFLIRSGFYHPIASPGAFKNYQFDWGDVRDWTEGTGDADGIWDDLSRGATLRETRGGRFD